VVIAFLETYGWTNRFLWALRRDANAPKMKMRTKSQRKWKSCISNRKCKREVCRSFKVSLLHSFVCTFTILQEHVIKIKYGKNIISSFLSVIKKLKQGALLIFGSRNSWTVCAATFILH